jgi:hypothetical protein
VRSRGLGYVHPHLQGLLLELQGEGVWNSQRVLELKGRGLELREREVDYFVVSEEKGGVFFSSFFPFFSFFFGVRIKGTGKECFVVLN